MYFAMNRFMIAPGFEEAFETMWRERESYLDQVPGFQTFHLLKGESQEDHTPYVSHSQWVSREAFVTWTDSEAFRKAHSQARSPEGMHLSHPRFEGFEVIL